MLVVFIGGTHLALELSKENRFIRNEVERWAMKQLPMRLSKT